MAKKKETSTKKKSAAKKATEKKVTRTSRARKTTAAKEKPLKKKPSVKAAPKAAVKKAAGRKKKAAEKEIRVPVAPAVSEKPSVAAEPEHRKPPVAKTPTVESSAVAEKETASLHVTPEAPAIPYAQRKDLKPLAIDVPITVKDLSIKIGEKPSALIKYLIEKQKTFVTINQSLTEELINKTLPDFGYYFEKKKSNEELLLDAHAPVSGVALELRPPVITLMGHVDHGKTSLLDAIRRSRIVDKEHGGITQHMGAYRVKTARGEITFLDTPGHEAFTAMRLRGANITDIVVLVVAADDGVMPQTVEAIDHAKAAGVPIVVAINKIDKQTIDLDRVKRQLSQHGLNPEDWGGQTVMVGVSAKTGVGIDELLELIALEAELLELKAAYDTQASGVVVEARLCKGQGAVVTVLVQNGTLKTGDNIICGSYAGKIRAMMNDFGERVSSVTPGCPAEILGFSGVPQAGEKFYVLDDEKKIKTIVQERQARERQKKMTPVPKHMSLDDLYAKIQQGEVKDLHLIIKADVQGSVEAILGSLNKFEHKEVRLNFLHTGVGPINASDVLLAEASNAVIIGFHVTAEGKAKALAREKSVEIRTYRVIYELISEIKSAMEGLLAPKIRRSFIGKALIKKVFRLSKAGAVAGCSVQRGKITRQATVTVQRGEETIYEGSISALKRFKDDVREVQEGYECGISLQGFTDYREGDEIIAYQIEKVARAL